VISKSETCNSFFLFIVALLVRIVAIAGYFQYNPCMLLYDAGHYHALAVRLTQGLGYVGADGASYFYRLPGYPLFLAACYNFFGEHPIAALCVQAFVGALIPIILFFLTRLIFKDAPAVGYLAAFVCCVHTGYIIYAGLVMSETLFAFLFILFCLVFFHALENKGRAIYQGLLFGIAGLILGLASLVRPVGIFVLLLGIGYIFFFYHRLVAEKILASVAISVGWLAVVGVWLLRNFLITGYLFFHTLSGPHFINHVAIKLEMAHEHCSYVQARDHVYHLVEQKIQEQVTQKNRPLLEIEECLVMEKEAARYMAKNYCAALKLFCENIIKTACALYSSELLVIEAQGTLPNYEAGTCWINKVKKFLIPAGMSWLICWWIWYEIFIWMLIALGCSGFLIASLGDKKRMKIVVQVIPFVVLFLGISLACGFARFRLPIEHFLIMLASKFWIDLYKK
jgi:4-amino-4-deoxy-L-arabinose transferase-like glycosyltransferase